MKTKTEEVRSLKEKLESLENAEKEAKAALMNTSGSLEKLESEKLELAEELVCSSNRSWCFLLQLAWGITEY